MKNVSDLINGDLGPYIHFSIDPETSVTYMVPINFLLLTVLWLHGLPAYSLYRKGAFNIRSMCHFPPNPIIWLIFIVYLVFALMAELCIYLLTIL